MLFWLPSYFNSRFHLDLKNLGLPLVIVYVATSIGSIGGGFISSRLIQRGWSVTKARQTTMLVFAFLVMPIAFSPFIENMWAMVGLLSLAAASHQGWSANLFTTASDMFPKAAVGSVVGIGGLAGALGATLFPLVVGAVLDHFKMLGHISAGYNLLFVVCGSAYLLAWVVMRVIRSSSKPVDIAQLAPIVHG
jgi:ACS family hexuronate transporter-like MFS transporter